MKSRRKPHKTLRQAAVLLCSGLLAVLLIWRSPSYGEAQSVRKAPAKKDASESTNNAAEVEKDTTPTPPAATAPPPEAAAAEPKAAADVVETKVAVAGDEPPKEEADGADKSKAKEKDGK